MPDLANRYPYERVIAGTLFLLQQKQHRRLLDLVASNQTVTDEYWKRNRDELASALALSLAPVYEVSANALYGDIATNRRNAREWAVKRALKIADEATAKDREAYGKLKQQHDAELAAAYLLLRPYERPPVSRLAPPGLDRLFGPNRATTLAVTSITGAHTAGQRSAIAASRGLLKPIPLGGYGKPILVDEIPIAKEISPDEVPFAMFATGIWIWNTSEDDKVCPICRPLNQKPSEEWAEEFPEGPPAHPNCRCWLEYSDYGN